MNPAVPRSCAHRRVGWRWRSFAVICLAGTTGPWLHAAIEWQQKLVEVSTTFKQQDVIAQFVFRNAGDRPVTIRSVDAACDCTMIDLEKKTYAAGESGRMNVIFEIGDYMGRHDAHILVITDTPAVPPTELVLRINIPEYFRLEPRMAIWRIGSEAQEKTIVCSARENQSVQVTAVYSSDPSVATRIETIEAGRKYAIHLKPASTASHIAATIQMHVAIADVGTRILNAYAYVKEP